MLSSYVTITLVNSSTGRSSRRCRSLSRRGDMVASRFERMLYRRLYRANDLDQVLLTIGLASVSVAIAAYTFRHHPATESRPPNFLRGAFEVFGLNLGKYRLFLILGSW